MYTFVFFVVQAVLLGNVLSQSTSSQSPSDIIQAAYTSVKNFKSNFENVRLRRDREFRYRLFDVVYNANDGLFNSLITEFYLPEDSKALALVEALKDTTDQYCVTRLRDFNHEIKSVQGREEYNFCNQAFISKREQLKVILSGAQDKINILADEADLYIRICKTVYDLRGNITVLALCVVEAQANLQTAYTDLDNKYKNLTPNIFVTGLASCIDSTLKNMQKVLNQNYELIEKCLSTSSNKIAVDLSAVLPSYRQKVSSITLDQVTEALANLKANSSATFANSAAVKNKIEQVLSKRSRSVDTLKILLSKNENVIKYERALNESVLQLQKYSNAKSCVNDAQNRFKNTISSRANEVRQCLDNIRQITSTGEISSIENNLVDRIKNEGEVAIVLCLTANGIVFQNRTVACSTQADLAFQTYLASVEVKLNQNSQKADLISAQIDSCERAVSATLYSSLSTNKIIFESCILNRASVNYTLTYE